MGSGVYAEVGTNVNFYGISTIRIEEFNNMMVMATELIPGIVERTITDVNAPILANFLNDRFTHEYQTLTCATYLYDTTDIFTLILNGGEAGALYAYLSDPDLLTYVSSTGMSFSVISNPNSLYSRLYFLGLGLVSQQLDWPTKVSQDYWYKIIMSVRGALGGTLGTTGTRIL